ncbi:porin [Azohydromonas caseinilytica]|uniref:Porin n=1 Tax=Azohydromonas caseinilytica TaxID=2728836 RepID=A0A848FHG0_9BURK|nr:porin [Azohydromonas caseinilytica]NML18918.1 porin [Azohydromonas caseinilytica]
MNVLKLYRPAVAAFLGVCATAALAEDSAFSFSGYGTLGAVRTNLEDSQAEFRSGARQNKGASRATDLGVDTRLGLQATYKFNEVFSAVGQVLASRRDDQAGPQVEWLYAQATPTQGVDLRIGRMVLPIFALSDNRNVGYAHYWVRAPQEVYGPYSPTSFDGVQARWRDNVGGVNLNVQASAGQTEADVYYLFRSKSTLKHDRLYSLAVSAGMGDWTLSASKTLGKDTSITGPVFNLPKGDDNFTNLALQYDNGEFMAMAEYVTRRYSTMDLVNSDSYYVSAGYRLGAWTPYAIYGHFTPKGDAYISRTDFGQPIPGAFPKGHTRAVGVRWDAYKNVAVKLQVESVKRTDFAFANRSFQFIRETPNVTAVSLAVDFVF